jgi:hypothetical protein
VILATLVHQCCGGGTRICHEQLAASDSPTLPRPTRERLSRILGLGLDLADVDSNGHYHCVQYGGGIGIISSKCSSSIPWCKGSSSHVGCNARCRFAPIHGPSVAQFDSVVQHRYGRTIGGIGSAGAFALLRLPVPVSQWTTTTSVCTAASANLF